MRRLNRNRGSLENYKWTAGGRAYVVDPRSLRGHVRFRQSRLARRGRRTYDCASTTYDAMLHAATRTKQTFLFHIHQPRWNGTASVLHRNTRPNKLLFPSIWILAEKTAATWYINKCKTDYSQFYFYSESSPRASQPGLQTTTDTDT
jgi:hypothetical protein